MRSASPTFAPAAAAMRKIFERVLAINPDSSVPLENLGVLALERGDLAGARRHFDRAVAADPRSSRAHAGLGVVALRAGDRQRAIEAWTRAVQLDATNFDARVQPRHDAGAQRAGGRRQAVPRAVPQDSAAGDLCQGSQGNERTVAPLSACFNHEGSKNTKTYEKPGLYKEFFLREFFVLFVSSWSM